jgi:AhpC/TSA family
LSSRKKGRTNHRPVDRRPLWSRRPWLFIGAGVAIAAALVVFVSLQGQAPGELGAQAGNAVPDIAQPATTGQPISLAQLRGSKVILYFYEGAG